MTAAPATDGVAGPIGLSDLEVLMHSVQEVTEQLQATHLELQGQVASLQEELAEANARLQRSRALAALGEMAAGIAHEIRNPLGSIQLYAQMLVEDLSDRPEQSILSQKIVRAVEGLDAIVRDVLLFAREMKPQAVNAPADELVDRALVNCASLIETGNIEVRRDANGSPDIKVSADATLATQALANVMRNAIEAMIETVTESRVLRIGLAERSMRCPDGRSVPMTVFRVADDGPGISDDVIDRMFNPFFTTRQTGTGLGLAIVHRIVDAHGGQVRVTNGSTGAVVELGFPIAAPISANGAVHPGPGAAARGAPLNSLEQVG